MDSESSDHTARNAQSDLGPQWAQRPEGILCTLWLTNISYSRIKGRIVTYVRHLKIHKKAPSYLILTKLSLTVFLHFNL